MRAKGDYAHGHALVVCCRDDAGAAKALKGLREELIAPDDLVRSVALEELMTAFRARAETQTWAAEFERRYLDLSPVTS